MKLENRTKEFMNPIKAGGHSICKQSEQEKDLEIEEEEDILYVTVLLEVR